MICPVCKEEKEIQVPGQYAQVLVCGHVFVGSLQTHEIMKSGANAVEADSIKTQLTRVETLPNIDTQEVVTRALSGMKKNQEEFFTSESILIEDIINEHGKDNAVLIFTAIHSHMSHVLFTMSRFRNVYFTKIDELRKEIEDKAVKELIQSHDFYYKDLTHTAKPKKINTPLSKTTNVEKAKSNEKLKGLTDKDGKPIDITKVLASLMWKKTPEQIAAEKEEAIELEKQQELEKQNKAERKAAYQKSLDDIANSIIKKEEAS